MPPRPPLPEPIELHRDHHWRRDPSRAVTSPLAAERFIDEVGFLNCLTDARRPGPSLFVAVCGRRDAMLPRNVQKDPESSETWLLKDELVRRGKVYYAKLARGKAMFVSTAMLPHFHAVWGVRQVEEARRLSAPARRILKVLRAEWEMATADLRTDARISDRVIFSRAMDELQAAMLVIPSEVAYVPKFTYIWTLAVSRFPDALHGRRIARATAVREIARCFLTRAGMTVPGELARVTGIPRPEAGLGNRALVAEGVATMPARGVYVLVTPERGTEANGETFGTVKRSSSSRADLKPS